MREVAGLSVEKGHTHMNSHLAYLCIAFFCCQCLGKTTDRLSGTAGSSEVLWHLLESMRPSDTSKNTAMHVLVCPFTIGSFSSLFSFPICYKSVQPNLSESLLSEIICVTVVILFCFNWPTFRLSMSTVNGKCKKNGTSRLNIKFYATCHRFPPSALWSTRRSCRPTWTQGSRQF